MENKKIAKKIVCMAMGLLLLGGCASSPRTRRVEAVQKLQEEMEKLKQTKMDKADIRVELDDFKTEIQILSGKIEESQYGSKTAQKNLEKNTERLDRLISDYDKKIIALENQLKEEAKKHEEKYREYEKRFETLEEKLEKAQKHPMPAANIKEDFINGVKHFKAKEYSEAITLFSRYIQNFPRGKSVQSARFYLADSYFSSKEYQSAILRFEEFKEKYSKDPKVPESIFKQGLSFLALEKKSDAKPFFSELVTSFPDSPFAKKAKTELNKLK